jgi:hypothetical protein
LDIFHISYGGIAIMVEVIWTETETHFSDDMIILLTSDAVITVVVVNPKILQNSKLTLKYEKIRTSELMKHYLVTPMLDGGLIMNDPAYLENYVKEIILNLVDHASVDSTASEDHFQHLKASVVLPLVEIVKSEEKLSSFLRDFESSVFGIDNDLFTDFFDNHYPQLKPKWDDIINTFQEIQSFSSKISSMIDSIVISNLNCYDIKHANNENGLSSTDYIIIPTFRERLIKCMIDNRDINTEIVRNSDEPYLILFKAETASVIYNPNAKRSTEADTIVNNLRNTARAVFIDPQIKTDFAHLRELRQKSNGNIREFARTLNIISHKTKLHMDSKCSFTTA